VNIFGLGICYASPPLLTTKNNQGPQQVFTRMMYLFLCIVLLFHKVLGNIEVRDGFWFQDINTCEQAIPAEKADYIKLHNETNIITMEDNDVGRSGNRFISISQYLAMGFCCNSLVELPETDEIFPSLDGGIFKSNERFFDFSNVDVPYGFEHLSKNSDVCPQNRIVSKHALDLRDIHDDLRQCISMVYVRGCEAAYFGDLVSTDTCQEVEEAEEIVPTSTSCRTPGFLSPPKTDINGTESLVVHIRSGDIFYQRVANLQGGLKGFGQPPLQYYIDAITSKVWASVTIITYNKHKDYLTNPVFSQLEFLNCKGLLGPNVVLYKNRDWLLDMKRLLCADAIVMSKSSTHCMTLAFTKARKFFIPTTCGSDEHKYKRGYMGGKRFPGNTDIIYAEYPDSSIYGIEWGGDSEYSVYKQWRNNMEQNREMLGFTDMTIQKCDRNVV